MGGASDFLAAFSGSTAVKYQKLKTACEAGQQQQQSPQLSSAARGSTGSGSLDVLSSAPMLPKVQQKRNPYKRATSDKDAHTVCNIDLTRLFPTNYAGLDATSLVYGLALQHKGAQACAAGYKQPRTKKETYVKENFIVGWPLTTIHVSAQLMAVATAAVLPAAAHRQMLGMSSDAIEESIEVGIFFDHDPPDGAGIKHAERERRRLRDHHCEDAAQYNNGGTRLVVAAMNAAWTRHTETMEQRKTYMMEPAADPPRTALEELYNGHTDWPPAATTFAEKRAERYKIMNAVYENFTSGKLVPFKGDVFVDDGTLAHGHVLPHNGAVSAVATIIDPDLGSVCNTTHMHVLATVDLSATMSTLHKGTSQGAPYTSMYVDVNCYSMVLALCAEADAFVDAFGVTHEQVLKRHIYACARAYEIAFGVPVCMDIARRVLDGEFGACDFGAMRRTVLVSQRTRTNTFTEADSLLLHHFHLKMCSTLKRKQQRDIDNTAVGLVVPSLESLQYEPYDMYEMTVCTADNTAIHVQDGYCKLSADSDVDLGLLHIAPWISKQKEWLDAGWDTSTCPDEIVLPVHSMRFFRGELQIVDLAHVALRAELRLTQTVVASLRVHEQHMHACVPRRCFCDMSPDMVRSDLTPNGTSVHLEQWVLTELFLFLVAATTMADTDYVHDISSVMPWVRCAITPAKVLRAVCRVISMYVYARGFTNFTLLESVNAVHFKHNTNARSAPSGHRPFFSAHTSGASETDSHVNRTAMFLVASLLVAEEKVHARSKQCCDDNALPCAAELEIVEKMYAAATGRADMSLVAPAPRVRATRGEMALLLAICKKDGQRKQKEAQNKPGKRKRMNNKNDSDGVSDGGGDDADAELPDTMPPAKRARICGEAVDCGHAESRLPAVADVLIAAGYVDAVDMHNIPGAQRVLGNTLQRWRQHPTQQVSFVKTPMKPISVASLVAECSPVLVGIASRTCFAASRVICEAVHGLNLKPDDTWRTNTRPADTVSKHGFALVPELVSQRNHICYKQVHPRRLFVGVEDLSVWLPALDVIRACTWEHARQKVPEQAPVKLLHKPKPKPAPTPKFQRFGMRVRGPSPTAFPDETVLPMAQMPQPQPQRSVQLRQGQGQDSGSETEADMDLVRARHIEFNSVYGM